MKFFTRTVYFVLLWAALLPAQTAAPAAAVQHGPNFDAERKQANDLFEAGKTLEALPLYEDLCRQDPTVAVFAERHAAGLLVKIPTVPDSAAQEAILQQATAELLRAQSLGDNSPYVQTVLSKMAKFRGPPSGVPLTAGYTYKGNAQAQAALKEAEADFARNDIAKALELYQRAAELDPKYYDARLFTGDMYFRMKDWQNAGVWFQKAIEVDPDRETAYRYWGDALAGAGDVPGAKIKYVQAVVAEPYAKAGWATLQTWLRNTKTPPARAEVIRPAFSAPDGKLQIDAALATETGDGHASWLVYQKARVAHGATPLTQQTVSGERAANDQITTKGYRHSLAEEAECLRAMLADVQQKLKSGTVSEDKLEPSLKTLLQLESDGMLESWILLSGYDAGILFDYPAYRNQHHQLLITYVERYPGQPMR